MCMIKSEQLNKNITAIYKKYAPKNMSLAQFTAMIEKDPELLDAIGGEFSSMNPELAQDFKSARTEGGMSVNDFRFKLQQFMNEDAINQVALEYAKTYADIICSDDDILKSVWTFDALTKKQKKDLACKLIKGINKHFGIEDKIKVFVDKPSVKMMLMDIAIDIALKVIKKIEPKDYYKLKRRGYYNDITKEIGVLKYEDFIDFMGILSHEYGNFIDHKYPNLGMLGSQISFYGNAVYSSIEGTEIYDANPTEKSSAKIAEIVEKHLERMLAEQTVKKPEIYVQSLRILVDYIKTQIASMNFQYRKEFKAIEKAEQEYDNIREDFFHRLYNDEAIEKLSNEEYGKAGARIEQIPAVKDKVKTLRNLKLAIPLRYHELESDLRYYNVLINAYDSDKKRFYGLLGVSKEY